MLGEQLRAWPLMPRISINIPDDILAELDETAEEFFTSRAAALRLHWKRYQELRTKENTIDMVGHASAGVSMGAHNPDPAGAGTSSSGSGSEREEKEREKPKSQQSLLPSARAVSNRVTARINELRPGRGVGFSAATYVPALQKLMRKGFTEEDLLAVVEWRAAEHRATGDWTWFKPATLFRVQSFAEKLDEARAGVKHGAESVPQGQQPLDLSIPDEHRLPE